VTSDLSTLMRQEVELAKVEVQQSAQRAGKGVGMFSGSRRGRTFRAAVPVAGPVVGDRCGHRVGLVGAHRRRCLGGGAAVLASVGRSALKSIRGLARTTDTIKKIPRCPKGNEDTA
jgi:Putative Actinobacterial Holin-X, holin superfamily III